MKILAFLPLLALVFLITVTPAHALDAKANILKAQIEGFLDYQKSVASKNNCTLETKGDITVEKSSGGYYAFTLPHITYTDAKGIKSEIGMVAINATPDGAHNWKISMAIPTPIVSRNQTGAEIFKTTLGSQAISGVWSETLGHFLSSNASLKDVTFQSLEQNNSVNIQTITFSSALKEQGAGVFTGITNLIAESIFFSDTESGLTGSLPKITMTGPMSARGAEKPLSKDDVANRSPSSHPDFYNLYAQMFGAPERVDGKIHGLDSLSAGLSKSMLAAKPESRASYLTAILGVGAVAALGKPDPSDTSVRYYDVVFGQNGQVLLNGTDFGKILTAKK